MEFHNQTVIEKSPIQEKSLDVSAYGSIKFIRLITLNLHRLCLEFSPCLIKQYQTIFVIVNEGIQYVYAVVEIGIILSIFLVE